MFGRVWRFFRNPGTRRNTVQLPQHGDNSSENTPSQSGWPLVSGTYPEEQPGHQTVIKFLSHSNKAKMKIFYSALEAAYDKCVQESIDQAQPLGSVNWTEVLFMAPSGKAVSLKEAEDFAVELEMEDLLKDGHEDKLASEWIAKASARGWI
ncbi:uncharacterized protein LY89DRAFT_740579 [Mollisia scopiformis]|uniref:Uncharacterized protein n=1 Tax=Mollisia scopiformis TaxID=149040 RepID=A0A132BCR1_MOLSC|nr:uncharacterized protein LY89DRAFT_740579 [Mollisia scopiformis]KUJ10186.1 hypothetical protein LY89DRAFT_740579 [Mollisia scopiformis]